MAVDLNVLCNFSMTIRGKTVEGFQGTDADGVADDVFVVSVDGKTHRMDDTLATATALKVWDDDTHKPADFDFMFFVADQDMTIQVIGSATNYAQKVRAGLPFVLGYDSMLAAANTTAVSGTEPSWEDVDNIVIQNNSGNDANYLFFCVD